MSWRHQVLFIGLFVALARCQDYTDECPEKNGFFADAVQCDRYYECKDGQIIDQLCPDGLVFDETSHTYAKCSFPFSVDCTERPELQKAQSTPTCPRRNGYFPHEDPTECGKFYFCSDGVANPITCPEGLIFSPKVGQCAYSDQAQREGCQAKDFFSFTCPNNPEQLNAHPRYPDPTDCQYFYVCIGGTEPRRTSCGPALVYNNATASCDRQEKVDDPVCRNWFNETYLESINANQPPPPTGIPLTAQEQKDRVVVRRRKPVERPAAPPAEVDIAGPPSVANSASRTRIPQSQVSAASFSSAAQPAVRQKVRTRVSLPRQPEEAAGLEPEVESGPPKFALQSDEDIQRFRDSNRFSPPADQGSRLTFLSVNAADRPAPAQQQQPDPAEFVDAPPPPPGKRFQSRRPPPATAAVPEPDADFNQEEPDTRAAQPPPVRGNVPRQRLQVTPIRVQPQAPVDVEENPTEFENFHRVPLDRQRSRGQQG